MRFWFLTSTTYGTWLPGDERGYVSSVWQPSGPRARNNAVGTPYDIGDDSLRQAAKNAMKSDAVFLTPLQAQQIIEQFLETCTYRGWTLHAAAVLCNHFHALVEVTDDPDPATILQSLKAYASRRLNKVFGRREAWWTDGGSKRKKSDEFAIYEAVRYARDQPCPYAIYLNPKSRYVQRLSLFEQSYRHDLESEDLNVFDPYEVLREAHLGRVLALHQLDPGEQGT